MKKHHIVTLVSTPFFNFLFFPFIEFFGFGRISIVRIWSKKISLRTVPIFTRTCKIKCNHRFNEPQFIGWFCGRFRIIQFFSFTRLFKWGFHFFSFVTPFLKLNIFYSAGKTIPTSSLMNVQNMRLKSEALKLLFAIIAETYSIEVSTSCVKEWIFPHFPHSDYQKIWPKKWLDDYLETNCAITILEKMTKSLRLPNPYYRVVPTIAGPSKRSKATNKIMMKHAALHRVEILLRDFKLEDGILFFTLSLFHQFTFCIKGSEELFTKPNSKLQGTL